MKKFLATTLFALCCSLFSFGQQTILLANETACPLIYQVIEVEKAQGGCSFHKRHNVTVAPYTGITLTTSASSGTEFNRGAVSFVNNNCMSLSIAAPSGGCVTCPITYFGTSYSTVVNCNNNCQGSVFNIEWLDCSATGSGMPYIVVWE